MASAAWERRNARARAAGYDSYYDYRIHDNGRIPPGTPVSGEQRQAGRGHRTRSYGELISFLNSRSERSRLQIQIVSPVGLERGPDGRWTKVQIVIFARDRVTGQLRERQYIIRAKNISDPARNPLSQGNLEALRGSFTAAGIPFEAAPSIDVFAEGEEPPDFDEGDYDLGELEEVG